MSDDEDEVVYVKRQKTIHYGTLEETMENRIRHAKNETETSTSSNVTSSNTQIPEYFDIEGEM
jgi:hypothetical protein